MHSRGFAVSALVVVLGALLACKKKEETTEPSATAPTAEPVPVAPATTTPPAPAESVAPGASAAPAATATATATATTAKPKPKTDAGAKPSTDAGSFGSAAPSAKPAPDAAAAPSASAPAPNTAASYAQIQACCSALSAEAQKDGPNKNRYKAASATCGAIAQSVKAGRTDAALAKTTIKAQLPGVPVPGACQ